MFRKHQETCYNKIKKKKTYLIGIGGRRTKSQSFLISTRSFGGKSGIPLSTIISRNRSIGFTRQLVLRTESNRGTIHPRPTDRRQLCYRNKDSVRYKIKNNV